MKAVVAAFNQEKALVGAFSVITNLRIIFGCNFLEHYPPGDQGAAAAGAPPPVRQRLAAAEQRRGPQQVPGAGVHQRAPQTAAELAGGAAPGVQGRRDTAQVCFGPRTNYFSCSILWG